MMTYRTYLRTLNGQVTAKTVRPKTVAAHAFAALVNRCELDGQKSVALTCKKRRLAFHHFERMSGELYWRDKLEYITWLSGPGGRPGAMEGGKRGLDCLDAESMNTAPSVAKGNVSEDIRKTLNQAAWLPLKAEL